MRRHGANQRILKHRRSSTNSTEQWTASNSSNYSTQQACVSAPSSFALVPMPHHRRSAHPWRVLQLKDDTSGSISFHLILLILLAWWYGALKYAEMIKVLPERPQRQEISRGPIDSWPDSLPNASHRSVPHLGFWTAVLPILPMFGPLLSD